MTERIPIESIQPSTIADPGSADNGRERVAWTRSNMPLLAAIRTQYEIERPFAGHRIGMCLHVEPKTAVLIEVLRAGGAEVAVTGSPATTDDGAAAYLAEDPGIKVYTRRSDTVAMHQDNIAHVLEAGPDMLIDNGADLVAMLLEHDACDGIIGGTEETTSGRIRYDEELDGRVPFPMIVINDSPLKLLIENQYGVGPTVMEGYMRTTNCLVPTNRFVVVGYGCCGRGIAKSLRAAGATVIVVEIDPIKALEAAFDGMLVRDLESALLEADVVITVTGRPRVLRREHLALLRDGAMLANAGHFSFEVDRDALAEMAVETSRVAPNVEEYRLASGKRLLLLGRGEMLNLTGATGNQTQVMDLGFALQLRSMHVVATASEPLLPGAQPVPDSVNFRVGTDMLHSLRSVAVNDQ